MVDGVLEYEGYWRDDAIDGYGTLTVLGWPEPGSDLEDGDPRFWSRAFGSHEYQAGVVYTGRFRDGDPVGEGTVSDVYGKRLGRWKDGELLLDTEP